MSLDQAARPLLTIAVPTYNRLKCLRLLLETLVAEIEQLPESVDSVELLIADNCSSDGTREYIRSLRMTFVRAESHATNLGADYNVRYCFNAARGRFVWIIGDDDLPKVGCVSAVVRHLQNVDPDLLFLPARGYDCDLDRFRSKPIPWWPIRSISRDGFSAKAGVFLTFLSAIVANRDRYESLCGKYDMGRCADTSLPHLEWVMSLVALGDRYSVARGVWVIGRAGNSGGYDRFRTFGTNYVRLVSDLVGTRSYLVDFFISDMLYSLVPSIVFSGKRRRDSAFIQHDSAHATDVIDEAFERHPRFTRYLVSPLFASGAAVTWALLILSVVVSRANKMIFLARSAAGMHSTETTDRLSDL